ncbi:hypothetical protein F4779DRAFT_575355 [Xylariaceae sp. FL0662B]|nr:hypothetical protein F4779DRAFT_575355 [Xylariaceae sp. FL0662B]
MASRKTAKPPPAGNENGDQKHEFMVTNSDGQKFEESEFPDDHRRLAPEGEAYWRSKLGEMLRNQFYPGTDLPFDLVALPEHYHLRARSRSTNVARQDFFLYGYPRSEGEVREAAKGGKKPILKCYRSPADFFPHLLWLLIGTNDRKQCSCDLCRAAYLPQETAQKPGIPNPIESKLSSTSPSAAHTGSPPLSAITNKTAAKKAGPTAMSTAKPKSTSSPTTRKVTPVPPPEVPNRAQPSPVASSLIAPAPVPTTNVLQPQNDESVLFKVGEVVWYKNNNTWRIGIILKVVPADPTTSSFPKNLIGPLAHPYLPTSNVVKLDPDMRPFLAFSVPSVNPTLQYLCDQPMESIDWQTVQAQLAGEDQHKREVLGLEASKIAASRVDHSYSLFNPASNLQDTAVRQNFGGVFLGAEKVGIYEAVRVRLEPQEENPTWNKQLPVVMALKEIFIERSEDGERLFFRGDIWRLEETASPDHLPNQDQLPLAMRREKAFRDEVKRSYGTHSNWVLVSNNAQKGEASIRGRFYESQKLGPILHDAWDKMLQAGHIPDIQASLNNRFDSRGPYIGRRKSRAATVLGAVPPNFILPVGPGVIEI